MKMLYAAIFFDALGLEVRTSCIIRIVLLFNLFLPLVNYKNNAIFVKYYLL